MPQSKNNDIGWIFTVHLMDNIRYLFQSHSEKFLIKAYLWSKFECLVLEIKNVLNCILKSCCIEFLHYCQDIVSKIERLLHFSLQNVLCLFMSFFCFHISCEFAKQYRVFGEIKKTRVMFTFYYLLTWMFRIKNLLNGWLA